MKSQVLLPKIFNFPFTYNSRIENKIGNLVEVPFGSKKEIGVIWKNNYTEPENIKIKYINKRTEYSIDRKLIDFIEWFSTYNMVPIGLVLKMAIGGSDNFIKNKDSSLPSALHYCDQGIASWFDIALSTGEIAKEIGLIKNLAKIEPMSSFDYPTPAARPKHTILDCQLTYEILGIKSIDWQIALKEILNLHSKDSHNL